MLITKYQSINKWNSLEEVLNKDLLKNGVKVEFYWTNNQIMSFLVWYSEPYKNYIFNGTQKFTRKSDLYKSIVTYLKLNWFKSKDDLINTQETYKYQEDKSKITVPKLSKEKVEEKLLKAQKDVINKLNFWESDRVQWAPVALGIGALFGGTIFLSWGLAFAAIVGWGVTLLSWSSIIWNQIDKYRLKNEKLKKLLKRESK